MIDITEGEGDLTREEQLSDILGGVTREGVHGGIINRESGKKVDIDWRKFVECQFPDKYPASRGGGPEEIESE